VRTRTLRATLSPTLPGTFRITGVRLRRGRHTLRMLAVDGNGNREPRALTYTFRLRR
jgi:hypothetical protein